MRDFNRGGRSEGGRGRGRRFDDRGSRGPVEMHKAICDNCGKECEVPFRPSKDKPVYCDDCFGEKRESRGRNGEGNSKQLDLIIEKLDKVLEIVAKE